MMSSKLHNLRRKIALLLLAACSATLLQGCWDRMEINDLAMVLATGIDRTKDGKVHLSIQIFIPRQSGSSATGGTGGSEGSPSGVTMVRTAEGNNIADAMARLQRKISRHVFWGHCEAIVIGEKTAKLGIREYMDFLLRFSQFREHAYVYISEPKAQDILSLLPPLERSSAEALREMGNMKLGTKMTVLDLAQALEGLGKSAVLSRLKIPRPESGQSKLATMPYIFGLAMIRNDREIHVVTEPMSLGVLMLLNQLDNIVLTVNPDEANKQAAVTIKPQFIRTEFIPGFADGNWTMEVNIKTKGDVILNTTDLSLLPPPNVEKIQALFQEQFKQRAEAALQLTQHKLKTDFFGYANAYRNHFPHKWKAKKAQWESDFPKIKTKIQVEVRILRTGKSGDPQGIPGQSNE
ncbi:Ger(x)C family spore germination protein [Paenibacillus sp. FSL H8-0537]|uniref:Ger(x)C family spore germination protein n=1 Tax=Paenibacillus sp. FSL H8-0537 TaxID=2921399 RepID=UPI00310195B3